MTLTDVWNALTQGQNIPAGTTQTPSPLSSVATVLGDLEKSRLLGLTAQTSAQQAQDKLAQQRALIALEAPGVEAGNSVRGDVLANAQDASVSGLPSYLHVPTISGGLRPSMLSANSRALGANMSRNALLNNMSGSDVPNLTPLPTASWLDSLLSGGATTAGLLSALAPLLGGTKPGSTSGGSTSKGGTGGGSSPTPTPTPTPGDGTTLPLPGDLFPAPPIMPPSVDPGSMLPPPTPVEPPPPTPDTSTNYQGTGGSDYQAYIDWLNSQTQQNGGGPPFPEE